MALAWSLSGAAAAADPVEVAAELARLAEVHGFQVSGLAHAEGGWGRIEGADLRRQLRTLLGGYDHVIVSEPGGGVGRVIILGEKAAWTPPERAAPQGEQAAAEDGAEVGSDETAIVLSMTRKGSQRAVKVSLEARGGRRIEDSLLVDTGADYLVLPRSMIAALGIDPQGLDDRSIQTANGRVTAKVGRIPGLWLGGVRIADVATAFIEDEALGANPLLGMSVLGRFRITIDDEEDELRLVDRGPAPSFGPGPAAGEPGRE